MHSLAVRSSCYSYCFCFMMSSRLALRSLFCLSMSAYVAVLVSCWIALAVNSKLAFISSFILVSFSTWSYCSYSFCAVSELIWSCSLFTLSSSPWFARLSFSLLISYSRFSFCSKRASRMLPWIFSCSNLSLSSSFLSSRLIILTLSLPISALADSRDRISCSYSSMRSCLSCNSLFIALSCFSSFSITCLIPAIV